MKMDDIILKILNSDLNGGTVTKEKFEEVMTIAMWVNSLDVYKKFGHVDQMHLADLISVTSLSVQLALAKDNQANPGKWNLDESYLDAEMIKKPLMEGMGTFDKGVLQNYDLHEASCLAYKMTLLGLTTPDRSEFFTNEVKRGVLLETVEMDDICGKVGDDLKTNLSLLVEAKKAYNTFSGLQKFFSWVPFTKAHYAKEALTDQVDKFSQRGAVDSKEVWKYINKPTVVPENLKIYVDAPKEEIPEAVVENNEAKAVKTEIDLGGKKEEVNKDFVNEGEVNEVKTLEEPEK